MDMIMKEVIRAESDDQLSHEDERDDDKEIPHAVPFKCIDTAHAKNY
jgi:hypothetical protein